MELSAVEYVHMFRMDQKGYNFNRSKFIQRFGQDFQETLRNSDSIDRKTGYIKYRAFKKEVTNAQKVFKQISDILVESGKKPLSNGLWGVFYASYVIETRKALFKHIQDQIDFKRKTAQERWASLLPLSSQRLKSDEDNTKNKPSKKGKPNP